MISDNELERMQATQNTALPARADVLREELTDDSIGGRVRGYVEEATDVPTRLGTPNQRERATVGDRFRGETTFVATFPIGTPIEAGDKVVFANGDRFDVMGINEPETFNTAVRAFLRRSDPDA